MTKITIAVYGSEIFTTRLEIEEDIKRGEYCADNFLGWAYRKVTMEESSGVSHKSRLSLAIQLLRSGGPIIDLRIV